MFLTKTKNNYMYHYKTNKQKTIRREQGQADSEVQNILTHSLQTNFSVTLLQGLSLKFHECCFDAISKQEAELLESTFAYIFPSFPLYKVAGVMLVVMGNSWTLTSHSGVHYKEPVRKK